MFLFYNYNFTLDFNGKGIIENRINSSTISAKVLTFLAFEAS